MAKASAKHPIEIKIGVQYSPRELTIEVEHTPQEVTDLVDSAVADGAVLHLTDVRGRQLMVPAGTISYVEIGPPEARRVGFGAGE